MTNEIKNVPELRFPEFKEEWSKLKLGELAEIVRGSSPRPISDPRWFDINSDIGWLRISDVTEQNGKITKLEQKISKDGQKKTRVLHSKHLLLSIAATVGKPVINYVKTGVHDGFLIFLRPLFDIEFMYQWLDAYRPKWKKYGQPGSQVNLNSELVKSQKIYMPHSVEQKKISDFFSKLDRQIELEEQKLAKLEEQKKGYMQKVFSQELRFKDENGNNYPEWEEKELGDVATIVGGGTPNTKIAEYWNGDINWFSPVEIGNDIFVNESKSKITELGLKKSSAKLLPTGTVLFTSRAGIGKTAILNSEACTNQGFQSIVPNQSMLDSYYIYSRTNQLKKYAEIVGSGSTFIEVSGVQMRKMPIMLPSITEQEKIGVFFKKIDDSLKKQSSKIGVLKERKKGFLQKMFV